MQRVSVGLRPKATAVAWLFLFPLMAIMSITPGLGPHIAGAAPPVMGDWVVTDTQTVTGQDFTLTGNLTVGLNGNLVLDDVNMQMNCSFNGQFNITVKPGGKLTIKNSTIAPTDFLERYRYNFKIEAGSSADIYDSTLKAVGEGNYTVPTTLGLYVESTNVRLLNNILTRTNIFSIAAGIIVGPLASPRIEGNEISAFYTSGITLLMGSHSMIRGNTIRNNGIAISCFLSTPQVHENVIGSNLVGLQFTQCDSVLSGNELRGNLFMAVGADSSDITMDHDALIDNGQDLSLNQSSLVARHVTMTGSTDGISVDHAGSRTVLFENCTLTTNALVSIVINDSTVRMLNTEFDQATVDILSDSGDMFVTWFLNISVSYASGARAPGATVMVWDAEDGLAHQGTTDPLGNISWVQIDQYHLIGHNRTDLTPHLLEATKGPYIGNATANVTGSMSVAIVLDDLVPVVTILEPAEGAILNRSLVTFRGNATDNNQLKAVEFRLPGDPWQAANGLDPWNFTSTLAEGDHEVQVRATDITGNQGLATVNISIDTIKPTLVILKPGDRTLTNVSKVTVQAKAEPGASVRRVPSDGGPDEPLSPDATGELSFQANLTEGKNVITLVAEDEAHNMVMRSVNVTLDTKPPLLYIFAPDDGFISNRSKVAVSGRTESGGNATVTLNGLPLTVAPNGTFVQELTLSDGTYTLKVVAKDLAGNTAMLDREVTVDTVKPGIEIKSPQDGFLTNSTLVPIKGRAQAKLIWVGVIEADILPDVEAGWWDFDELYPMKEGTNNITVVAQDAAGNRNSASIKVTLDTIPPSLNISEPMNAAEVTTAVVNIVGTTEAGATMTINGQLVDDTDGTFSIPVDLVKGENKITIRVKDKAGNPSEVTLTVTRKDKVAPGTTTDNCIPMALIIILLAIAVFLLAYRYSKGPEEDTDAIDYERPVRKKGRSAKDEEE